MKNKNSNVLIVAIIGLAVVGIVAVTLAYFSSISNASNDFTANRYKTQIVRSLSDQYWLPGTVISLGTGSSGTDESLKVKNLGNVPIAVRAKYEESILRGQSETPQNLTITVNNTTEDVIIKTIDTNWILGSDGWYYYNSVVPINNGTTTNFITELEFNQHIELNPSCSEVATNDGTKITCDSRQYDDSEYNLTITFETIQSSAFSTWQAKRASNNTNITLS